MSRLESDTLELIPSETSGDSGDEPSELEIFQAEDEQLQESLNEDTAKRFEFFREDGQATDTTLQQKFEHLRSSTASWIEDVLAESEPRNFRRQWEKLLQQKNDSLRSLAEQMFLPAQRITSDSIVCPKSPLDWLGVQSNCERLVLTRGVWRFFHRRIFSRRWPIGAWHSDREKLSHGEKALMNEIFDIIVDKDEDPTDPFSKSNLWRSQTFEAMTQTVGFKGKQDKATKLLLDDFAEELYYWTGLKSASAQKFKPRLIDLAIDLHTSFVCSRRSYQIAWPDLERHPQNLDLRQWQLKDIVTWISPGNVDEVPIPIIAVVPGLRAQRSVQDLTLVKPTMVVCDAQKVVDGDASPRKPDWIGRHSPEERTTRTRALSIFNRNRSRASSPASKPEKSRSSFHKEKQGKERKRTHSDRPFGSRPTEPRPTRSGSSTPRPSYPASRTASLSSREEEGDLDRFYRSRHGPQIWKSIQVDENDRDGLQSASHETDGRRRRSIASPPTSESYRAVHGFQSDSKPTPTSMSNVKRLPGFGLMPSQVNGKEFATT